MLEYAGPSESAIETIGDGAGLPSRKRKTFGRDDLDRVYLVAKDLLVRHKMFRLCTYEEIGEVRRLDICNYWRIERQADGSIVTFEHDLVADTWRACESLQWWPDIPFYPFAKTRSLSWWRDIVRRAIWKSLYAAGYADLPKHLVEVREHSDWKRERAGRRYVPKDVPADMARHTMAGILLGKYLGGTKTRLDGFLSPKTMESGARALRAAFLQHFLDKEVMAAMLAIDYRYVAFREYLYYAKHRDGFLKIWREHRNLITLAPSIHRKGWLRPDLFSRDVWVKDGRKSTAIDRRPLRGPAFPESYSWQHEFIRPLQSFDNPVAWRWLLRAPSRAVGAWVSWNNKKDPAVITNIALANVNQKVPVNAYVRIIKTTSEAMARLGVSPVVQQTYRLFLLHCSRMWRTRGWIYIRDWLKNSNDSDIGIIFDYLSAEGINEGHPTKQDTWASLVRRSHEWHTRTGIENLAKSLRYSDAVWESLVPETIIDGVRFVPLNTAMAVAIEGAQQHHCVGDYADSCAKGHYRVYSVIEPDGGRSTLGFALQKKATRWDQHRGPYNDPVTPEAMAAGRQLVALYQEALHANSKSKIKATSGGDL